MKFIFIFLLFLAFNLRAAKAETFYHFSYHINKIAYNAFFVLNADESGFMRIRFDDEKGNAVLYETTLVPVVLQLADGSEDSKKMVFNTQKAALLVGDYNDSLYTPNILFELNETTQQIEPICLVDWKATQQFVPIDDAQFSSVFKNRNALDANYLRQFFEEGESYITDLGRLATRSTRSPDKTTRMLVLLVANTNEADIGQSCAKDLAVMQQMYTDIAKTLNVTLSVKVVSGSNYSKSRVQSEINALAPGANDMVIFYYTGHGYRKLQEPQYTFPFMDLRAKPTDNYLTEAMNVESVYNTLKAKNARFTLVMSDCCNSDVEMSNAIATAPLKTKAATSVWNMNALKELFMSTKKISIIATAAEWGQRASSNNTFGGFFTYYYKSSMESYGGYLRFTRSWYNIFEDAKQMTISKANRTYCEKPYIPANICKQYPTYTVDIKIE